MNSILLVSFCPIQQDLLWITEVKNKNYQKLQDFYLKFKNLNPWILKHNKMPANTKNIKKLLKSCSGTQNKSKTVLIETKTQIFVC